MFEYFYLIILIVCTGRVFSYEYIDRRNALRQDYAYDRNPVEFDVAGFIQPEEGSVGGGEVAHPRSKSTFKHMKFPFFSPNKTKSLEAKRAKKRRLFCFASRKKSTTVASITMDNKVHSLSEKTISPYKNKRSYEVKLCPVCHRRFPSKPKRRNKKSLNIHNSRQYYLFNAGAGNKNLSKDKEDNENRDKRVGMDNGPDKDRQMRLLEEIQRKVDNVKITTPKPFRRITT